MSATPVRFLFDYISPNAYIAWERIHELAGRYGRSVEPVPVLFAGMLNAHELVGPAESRAKWSWMLRDIVRKAERLGIDLAPPPSHPFNPLLALRVTTLPMSPEIRDRLIGALFRAVWAGGPGITEADEVARIATGVGLEGARAVERAMSDDGKRALRRNTDDAVARGAFGVPTMLVDDELFWGYDDFEKLDDYLAGQLAPLSPDTLAAWTAVRPSANRRQ